MGTQISTQLALLGFTNVLGTTEYVKSQYKPVVTGTPLTHQCNQGVHVIYDENGHPWVVRLGGTKLANRWDEFVAMNKAFPQTPGAYVPHSNDGGGRTAHSRQHF